jgi:serine/arginine repetitive matrix protein 2
MRSVVEVSSLDPKAAARAAAILKLVSSSVRNCGEADE